MKNNQTQLQKHGIIISWLCLIYILFLHHLLSLINLLSSILWTFVCLILVLPLTNNDGNRYPIYEIVLIYNLVIWVRSYHTYREKNLLAWSVYLRFDSLMRIWLQLGILFRARDTQPSCGQLSLFKGFTWLMQLSSRYSDSKLIVIIKLIGSMLLTQFPLIISIFRLLYSGTQITFIIDCYLLHWRHNISQLHCYIYPNNSLHLSLPNKL